MFAGFIKVLLSGVRRKKTKFESYGFLGDTKSLSSVFCILTHDIDTHFCAENLEAIINIENKLGLNSTINVLTDGPYSINDLNLHNLEKLGFEIGLHGDSHDIAFGFRNYEKILERLKFSRSLLYRHEISVFRAPGLAATKKLYRALSESGFKTDLSAPGNSLIGPKVINNMCVDSHTSIVSIPLDFSDDLVLRELKLNFVDQISLLKNLAYSKPSGNPFTINIHPGLYINRLSEYEHFLHELKKIFSYTGSVKDYFRRIDLK